MYSREQLIEICEKAIVQVTKWSDRDTPDTQRRVGECWALLKAGCDFDITEYGDHDCVSDENTIWLYVKFPSFSTFNHGRPHTVEHYYLPTPKRLAGCEGHDWY